MNQVQNMQQTQRTPAAKPLPSQVLRHFLIIVLKINIVKYSGNNTLFFMYLC